MKLIIAVVVLLLTGCSTMNMTPEQLKASAGMATCGTSSTMYGKVSLITASADDVRKGNTGDTTTTIKCGDASMEITTKVGVVKTP